MDATAFGYLFIGLFFTFVLFVALRAIVLWYFRINEIADDLHVIAQHYRQLASQPLPPPTRPSPTQAPTHLPQSLTA